MENVRVQTLAIVRNNNCSIIHDINLINIYDWIETYFIFRITVENLMTLKVVTT